MPNETVTLREFLVEKLETYISAHRDVHAVEQRNVSAAAEAMRERLDGMNEFRAQLDKQAALFITRDMRDADFAALLNSIENAEESMNLRLAPVVKFQETFYVQAIAIGVAFTLINIAINYFGLGK